MKITTRPITTTCSGGGCGVTLVVDRGRGTVTARIPSNGKRGRLHVPAQVRTEQLLNDDDNLVTWDCPACDYADSFDLVDGVSL